MNKHKGLGVMNLLCFYNECVCLCVFCLLYLCQSGKMTGDKVSRQPAGGVLKPVVCVYSCSVIFVR